MASFVNPFRRNNTMKRNNRNNRNNYRNNTLDKYIIDNYDDLLNEDQIKRYMRNSGSRNNAVRRTLKNHVSSHGLDNDRDSKLLVEYIIKKNSGLTKNQKINLLNLNLNQDLDKISKIVRNIHKSRNIYNQYSKTNNFTGISKNHYLSNVRNNNVTRRNNINGYNSNTSIASNPRN